MGFEAGYGAPSATNVYIPADDVAQLITAYFTRDAADFKLNRYSQIINVDQQVGYYKRFDPSFGARLVNTTDSLWPDGQPAPSGANNKQLFTNVLYEAQRRHKSWEEGRDTIDQATNDWEAIYAQGVAQQKMTEETLLSIRALERAEWGTSQAQVDGGLLSASDNFSNGTESEPHIMDALGQAQVAVSLATYSKVSGEDLILLVNPRTARRMAISQEVHSYLARSEFSLDVLRGNISIKGRKLFGLPPELYGLQVEVEDAAYEPTHYGETRTPQYVVPDGTAYLLSRKGGIEGAPGTGTFATLVRLYYGAEDQYESMYDEWDRIYRGRVTWNADYQVSSVLTGFRLTNLFGDTPGLSAQRSIAPPGGDGASTPGADYRARLESLSKDQLLAELMARAAADPYIDRPGAAEQVAPVGGAAKAAEGGADGPSLLAKPEGMDLAPDREVLLPDEKGVGAPKPPAFGPKGEDRDDPKQRDRIIAQAQEKLGDKDKAGPTSPHGPKPEDKGTRK